MVGGPAHSEVRAAIVTMRMSRTGWTLDCRFVGCRVKPEKPPHPSSLSCPVDTAHVAKLPRERNSGPITQWIWNYYTKGWRAQTLSMGSLQPRSTRSEACRQCQVAAMVAMLVLNWVGG